MTVNAKELLEQLKHEFNQHSSNAVNNLALISKLLPVYAEAVQDLLDAETKYAELTNKYTKPLNVGTAHMGLPGLAFQPLPLDINGVKTDTATLEHLGSVIEDLQQQKAVLSDQVNRCLRIVVDSFQHQVDSETQMFVLMEEGLRLVTKDGSVGATIVPVNFAR